MKKRAKKIQKKGEWAYEQALKPVHIHTSQLVINRCTLEVNFYQLRGRTEDEHNVEN